MTFNPRCRLASFTWTAVTIAASHIACGTATAKPAAVLAQPSRWRAEAPIPPAGILVAGGHVALFGRGQDGSWKAYSGSMGWGGLVVPEPAEPATDGAKKPEKPSPWKDTTLQFPEGFDPLTVRTDAAAAFFVPGDGKQAAMITMQEDGSLTAPIVFSVPLERIDDVQLTDKRLYVLGAANGEAVVMHRFATAIGSPDQWQASLPLLDGRVGASLFAGEGQLLVTGGFVKSGDAGTVNPIDVYRSKLDEDGSASSWEMIVQRLPQGVGRSSGASSAGFLGLLGDVSVLEDGDECTSQTLSFAYHRKDGRLTLWQSGVFDMPALEGAFVEADEKNNQFLVAGGKETGSGSENKWIWAFGVPRTREAREKFDAPLTIPLRRDEVLLVEHQAALARAKSEGKYHLVLLAGDDNTTSSNKAFITRNRDAIAVMKDFMVSIAGEEAAAELRRKINQPEGPASVLLDPNGAVVGAQAGALDGSRLYQLLKPAWEPVAPAQ